MCGRYVMSKATGNLLSHFRAEEIEGSLPPPSWNVAPTQDVPIIAERLGDDSVDRRLLIARWGLPKSMQPGGPSACGPAKVLRRATWRSFSCKPGS
ncbi:MAG: SOS response-associated peptidase family protein [Arthrobacter sp.]